VRVYFPLLRGGSGAKGAGPSSGGNHVEVSMRVTAGFQGFAGGDGQVTGVLADVRRFLSASGPVRQKERATEASGYGVRLRKPVV
jgi:hypothetical protein